MKTLLLNMLLLTSASLSYACDQCANYAKSDDFKIRSAKVVHNKQYGHVEFEITVAGKAGNTIPTAIGKLDMAPVLGYVIPTTLKSEDIGFGPTEGIVAMALTSHPDFDDTPLWDENNDKVFDNDGVIWHAHWVILVKDDRVGGGLSVKGHGEKEKVIKPKTAPDMPMYMDSPGFQVVTSGNSIRVSIPDYRINNKVNFNYDAVACYMQVSAPEGGAMDKPMLGVYNVFNVLSKDLSLPYAAK